jgi:hypothetical protein
LSYEIRVPKVVRDAQQLAGGIITRQSTAFKRVVFAGTKRSAKTTALGCLSLACDLKSLRDKNFRHYIDERTSGICQVPSDLCSGHFPEETPAGLLYEADLYLTFKKFGSEKTVILPFMETAGEDIENLAGPYTDSIYRKTQKWEDADVLNKTICDANGYVLVIPVNQANIPYVPPEFLDRDLVNSRNDPDLSARRVLNAIYRHKREDVQSPKIDGIAVLLTKYDAIADWTKSKGMDLTTQDGAQRFLSTYFRQTMGMLKYYGIEKVKFFPMWVTVEKEKQTDGRMAFGKHPDGTLRIALDYQRNLPMFAEQSNYSLIDWIEEVFAK